MKTRFLRQGLDLRLGGQPQPSLEDGPTLTHVAMTFDAYTGLQPELLVQPGQRVSLGQPVVRERRWAELVFTAPVNGTTTSIERGRRRQLGRIEFELDQQQPAANSGETRTDDRVPRLVDDTQVRDWMLRTGLWTRLRSRPFDDFAAPDQEPEALFITAIDTRPLAACPRLVVAEDSASFARGIELLCGLTDSPIYLCQPPGQPLLETLDSRVHPVAFDGAHPAGLPGTHIHLLHPLRRSRQCVWHINYQDVLAIGRSARHQTVDHQLVLALGGSSITRPRLLRTLRGAPVAELLRGEQTAGAASALRLTGDPLLGRQHHWLGPFDQQLTVLQPPATRLSSTTLFHSETRLYPLSMRPFSAEPVFDQVSPLRLQIVPLLRALALGDLDTALALGCLELAPEDLAVFSYVCPAGNDYGALLADALTRIRAEASDAA